MKGQLSHVPMTLHNTFGPTAKLCRSAQGAGQDSEIEGVQTRNASHLYMNIQQRRYRDWITILMTCFWAE